MKNFSLKKFKKDRERSLKGSKNGDYKLINHNEGRSNINEIISNIQVELKNISCLYLDIGCKLPYWKRNTLKCKDCPMVK